MLLPLISWNRKVVTPMASVLRAMPTTNWFTSRLWLRWACMAATTRPAPTPRSAPSTGEPVSAAPRAAA